MDIAAFRAALGDIPVEDNPRIVQQKSRDIYWYSPVPEARSSTTSPPTSSSRRATSDEVDHRARRRLSSTACRSRRAAPAPAITARPCRSPAASMLDLIEPRQGHRDRARTACAPRPASILAQLDEQTKAMPSAASCASTPRPTARRRSAASSPAARAASARSAGAACAISAISSASRSSPGGRAARARPHRRGHPQGRPRLRHQRHHHRGRDAADRRPMTGSTSWSASTTIMEACALRQAAGAAGRPAAQGDLAGRRARSPTTISTATAPISAAASSPSCC